MRVLGIETSCDETGLAIYDSERGLLGQRLHSQVILHRDYGGVVPELAARDHIRHFLPLLGELLADTEGRIPDAVAYTQGPGLAGALMVGAMAGRALAYAWRVPALGIHHLEGHLLMPLMDATDLQAPFLSLLVSGGHTQLLRVRALGDYELLGESIDDAVGEAFDKVAKMLGLDYPGGPAVARLAETGDDAAFDFPQPMLDRPGLDFSFSGLKTAVRKVIIDAPRSSQRDADICASFEYAVVATLVRKCQRAVQETGLSTLVLAGGVAANVRLRRELAACPGLRLVYPPQALCTDNGAMIAYAGCRRLLHAAQGDALGLSLRPRWPLSALSALTGES